MKNATRISTRMELDRAFEASGSAPVLLFKHSLTCPLSTTAWRVYRSFLEGRDAGDPVLYAYLEVQNARDVSNEVARRTGVRHESPQALLLKGGECLWSASHGDISEVWWEAALAAAGLGTNGTDAS